MMSKTAINETINPPNQKKRIVSLDILRALAIFCVLITHSSDGIYAFTSLDVIPKLSFIERLFALTLHIIGRCGVPIFFFLTGYLVLSKKFSNSNDILSFWKKHLLPLFITSTIWGIIYYIYGIAIECNNFSLMRLLMELSFFVQYEGAQFWYIPVILGMYIFIPFVSIVLNKVDQKPLFIVFLFTVAINFIPPMINPILAAKGSNLQFNSLIDLSWSGNEYGLLILFGYWIKKTDFKIKKWQWLILGIICFAFLLWEENFCFMHKHAYDLWYNNLALILLCVSIFEVILSLEKSVFSAMFTYISKNAFGIFLIHELFIKYTSKHILNFILWRKFFILLIITITLSVVSTFLIGLNKKARWILLYRK